MKTIFDLIRRGWKSGIYTLRVDALEFLQWMRRGVEHRDADRRGLDERREVGPRPLDVAVRAPPRLDDGLRMR